MATEHEVPWSESTQGLVLSSFFWGYICTQLPSGALSVKFGPHRILLVGMLLSSVAVALTPIFRDSVPLIITFRVITGIGEGTIFTSVHTLTSNWIPLKERALMINVIWNGGIFGTMLTTGITPLLNNTIGWTSSFYILGYSGILWVLVYALTVTSSPLEMKEGRSCNVISIRNSEYKLIVENTNTTMKEHKISEIPWGLFFSHMAVWALMISHFIHNWGFYVLLTWMPKYLKSLGFDISRNGVSALFPYLTQGIMGVIFGRISDYIVTNEKMSKQKTRKMFILIGFLSPAIMLTIIAFRIKGYEDGFLAVGLLCVSMGLSSASTSGYGVNHMDLGPDYAGILISISNTVATIPGIVGVYITGFILDHSGNNWKIVWLLAASLYVFGAGFFTIFGKAKRIF